MKQDSAYFSNLNPYFYLLPPKPKPVIKIIREKPYTRKLWFLDDFNGDGGGDDGLG